MGLLGLLPSESIESLYQFLRTQPLATRVTKMRETPNNDHLIKNLEHLFTISLLNICADRR